MQGWILNIVENVLRFLHVPHIAHADSIELVHTTLNANIGPLSAFGWPVFSMVAGGYCWLRRRSWLMWVLNLISASLWWVLFHVAVLVVTAIVWQRGTQLAPIWIYWTLLPPIILLFLSTESGVRGMLAPITGKNLDTRRVNPLVVFWNRLAAVGERGNAEQEVAGS
ncbi:MAG: hypothetical protein NXI32_28000 [bacterium]|nr:hypothetical protein [bacterium]